MKLRAAVHLLLFGKIDIEECHTSVLNCYILDRKMTYFSSGSGLHIYVGLFYSLLISEFWG